MKKCKFVLAVLMSAIIIILSGCSGGFFNAGNKSEPLEITALAEKTANYVSVDISGENLVFLTADTDYESYTLTVYNAKKDSITAKKEVGNIPLDDIQGVKFNSDDEIMVYNTRRGVIYDRELNMTAEGAYTAVSEDEMIEQSELIGSRFAIYDNYAVAFEDKNIFVFFDDLNTAYISDSNYNSMAACGKKIFYAQNTDDRNDITLSVYDYENAVCINTAVLAENQNGYYFYPMEAALSDKYVCVILEYADQSDETAEDSTYAVPLIWEYGSNAENSEIDVEIMAKSDFEAENTRMIEQIKADYTINVYVDKETDAPYEIEFGVNTLDLYLLLTDLSDCLALFPDNFFVEMYDGIEGLEDFSIYIVENIDGATAFAESYKCSITFGVCGFYRDVVFHELMHLIDTKLYDYYYYLDQDFYDMWCSFNADDFTYGSDYDDLDTEYFVSLYAMTNYAEDMADTFMCLCQAAESGEKPEWLGEYEHVSKKAVFLCESIRRTFPSVAAADEMFWEKYMDYDN